MEVRGRSGQGAALKKAEALGKKGKEQKTIMLFEKKSAVLLISYRIISIKVPIFEYFHSIYI